MNSTSSSSLIAAENWDTQTIHKFVLRTPDAENVLPMLQNIRIWQLYSRCNYLTTILLSNKSSKCSTQEVLVYADNHGSLVARDYVTDATDTDFTMTRHRNSSCTISWYYSLQLRCPTIFLIVALMFVIGWFCDGVSTNTKKSSSSVSLWLCRAFFSETRRKQTRAHILHKWRHLVLLLFFVALPCS